MPHLNNGLYEILRTYQALRSTHAASPTWLKDFSNGVIPIQCHSHNDYWHRVPLYEGLSAGRVSTEADIWLDETSDGRQDLFIGHDSKSWSQSRTLRSLYLEPLADILFNKNVSPSDAVTVSSATQLVDTIPVGVFSNDPSISLFLLLDFKTSNDASWETVNSQLSTLRDRGWLTIWTTSEGVVQRPVTIVAAGETSFDSIVANATYRDIFFDAPLTQLSDSTYNSNNSYYASSSLKNAVGSVRMGRLNNDQKTRVTTQVERVEALGLKSRYWDIPSWPISWRNQLWGILMDLGTGVLNVDDLIGAARWDSKMCVVGGLNICSS